MAKAKYSKASELSLYVKELEKEKEERRKLQALLDNHRKSGSSNGKAIAPIRTDTASVSKAILGGQTISQKYAPQLNSLGSASQVILTGANNDNPFSIENLIAQQQERQKQMEEQAKTQSTTTDEDSRLSKAIDDYKQLTKLGKQVEAEKKQAGIKSQTDLQQSAFANKFSNQFTNGKKEKDIKQIIDEAKQNQEKEKEFEKNSKTYQQYEEVKKRTSQYDKEKKQIQKLFLNDVINFGKEKAMEIDDARSIMPGNEVKNMLKRVYYKTANGEKITPSDVLMGSNVFSSVSDFAERRNEKRLNEAKDNETTLALKQAQAEKREELIKARNSKSKDYNKILKEYNEISDSLQTEQAKLIKKHKGIFGAIEKGGDTFTGGLTESTKGMESTVDKVFGVKSEKRLGATGVLDRQAIEDTKSKAGKFLLEEAHSVGAFVPSLVAGIGSGGLATAVSFGSYGGSAYNQAKRDGYSEEQATRYGVVNGGLEALLNKFLPSLKFGGKSVYGKVATDKLTKKIMSKTLSSEAFKRWATDLTGEFTEEYLQNFLDPIVRESLLEEDNGVGIIKGKKASEIAKNIVNYTTKNFFSMENLKAGFSGAFMSGTMGGPSAIKSHAYTKATGRSAETGLTQNEQAVMDNVVENRKAELKEKNGKVTKKDVAKIEKDVRQDLERGYLDTNEIERALSNDEWTKHNEVVKQKESLENRIQELENKTPQDYKTMGELNSSNEELSRLKEQLDNMDTYTTRNALSESMMSKISDYDTLLRNSYNQEAEKNNSYQFDKNEEVTETTKQINEDIKNLNLNNHIKTRDTIDMLKKISNDTGRQIRLVNNNSEHMQKEYERIVEKIAKQDNISKEEARKQTENLLIDGFVSNGVTYINVDSENLINRITGHETTHLFEGTEEYSALQSIAKKFAETKGEYESRKKDLQERYRGIEDADIENELTSDLVGDYLFSDIDFVRSLKTEQPSVFKKIYNHVKHLYNMATAGSKEARQLEQLKYNFEKVYRENNQSKASNNTKFSIQTDSKGNKYVNVDTDQDIFDGIDEKDYNKIAKMYINDYLKGKTILSESDTAIIDSKTAKKYTNPGKKQPNFSEKMRLTPELKNVLEISEKVGESSESKDNSKYKNWEYYRTIFKINNEMFEGLVNIGIDSKGNKHLYEVNNIKKTSGISETSPNRPTGFSDSSIPQNEQKVNSGIPTKYSIQNKGKNTRTDNSSFSLNKLPKVKDGYTRLYRGLNNDYDANYDRTTLDSPNGYDTLTDNYELAKQYGKNVYYIDIPTNQIADSVIDENPNSETYGDRNLAYKDDKPAGLNGVSGDEYLLYTDHDDFDSNNYHKVEGSNTNNSISNKDSTGRTLTKEQQEYFKDSKVRDKDGNLIPVYHGSKGDNSFTIFDKAKIRKEPLAYGNGFYFTPDYNLAQNYNNSENTKEVYVDLQNPFIVSSEENLQDLINYKNEALKKYNNVNRLTDVLKENGYDGVIGYDDILEDNQNAKIQEVVAFESSQIKNVDNNSPTSNSDIRYSISVKEANTGKDNNGVKLSKTQKEYFKDSKATDEEGNLITVYHTTTNEIPQFNEFNPVGTPYYRFGDQVVNYYTNSKDMSGSYASQDYKMADTKKLNNIEDAKKYMEHISKLTGNVFDITQRGDNKFYATQDKQISKEARNFIEKLSETEKQQMLDNIYEDEKMKEFDPNYSRVFSWNYFDKPLQEKYNKLTEKYLGTADTVAIQQEVMKYLESPVLLHEDARFNGEIIGVYDTEEEMLKNIKTDMQKSDWSKNSKIQYEGYVNITNPYIIDAEERNWNQVIQESNDFIDELEERVPQDVKDNLTRLYQESANKSAEARENYEIVEQVIRQGIDGYQSAVDEEIQKANQVVKKVGFNEIEQILNDTQNIGVNPWYNIAEALQDEGVIGSATKTFIIDEFKLPKQVKEWLQENYNKGIPLHQIPTNNPLKLMEQLDRNATPSLKDIYNKNAQNYEEFDKYRMPNSYFMEQISSEGNDYLGNELNDIFETRAEIYSPEQVGEEIAQASSVAFSKPEMIRLWGTSKTTNDVVKEIIASNKDGKTDYDGVIIKNVYDYGGHSATGTQANDLYITFNSNQFKALDNTKPTEDADIRYKLSDKRAIAPIKKNNKEIFGSEMLKQQDKVIKQAIAPLNKEIKTLKKEVSDLKENASTDLKTFEEQNKQIAPLLEEQVAPPESESVPSIKDNSKMSPKDLKALSKNMKQQLGLTNKQKLDLENIIQEYSTSETATREDLFNEIKKRYGKESITTEFEDIKNVQNEIKNTKLNVSQNIKNDITDYNKLKQRNFGKIRFNKDGSPVDVVYQELSSRYPNYFPSNIFNESDQFNKIVEVANLENKSIEEYDIDDEFLREASDYIYDSIEESKQDAIKRTAEKERVKNLKTLAPIEKAKQNPEEYIPYLEMAKEINNEETDNEINEILEDANSKNKKDNVKTKPRKHGIIADTKRTLQYWFTNRNAEIDEYARETGNKNIKILADQVNNIQGEITTNINDTQRDNYGNIIGKGITKIFDQARKENKSDAFNDYLFHKSNMARHKQGKGSLVDYNESEQLVKAYEKDNPEFKDWGKEVNDYNINLLYKQAEAGLITEELADNLTKMYDFYVPFFEDIEQSYNPDNINLETRSTIKSARGGADKNLLGFEEAMMRQTQSAITQIRKNQLYNEIIKTKANRSMDFENNIDPNVEDTLQENGGKYYLTGYENGKATQVEIDKDLYHGLAQHGDKLIKQAEKKMRIITKPLQWLSDKRRKILTSWSPTFIITNPAKDLQDAPLNSKYAKDWAKNVPRAFKELLTGKGENIDAFLGMYGQANLRGDYNLDSGLADVTKLAKTNKKSSAENTKGALQVSKKMLGKIPQLNEIIELAPRYAEYLASLENGCSQMEALYNAREVTTNFGKGGIITKALNRNGFTFLNANVQGMSKLVRNFSGENGGRAVLGCIAKASAFGLAPALINAMLLGDDDDYEAIPDYIKDNYYLIKTSDNSFIRIPKGRMMSIFGSAGRRALERSKGKRDELSLKQDISSYVTNAYNQVGIQNPFESNIFAPLIQAKNNKTWYGSELVPKRLQTDKEGRDIPASEQYDAGTDKMSIWLGKHTGISPYKINYVVDQYSGGIGDMILPTITEEAQSKSNSVVGKAIAPLKDKFSADSITDNKNVTNFYSKVEELGKKPAKDMTKKDEISYQYMRNLSFEMGSLYKEMREVQSDKKMSDSKKYAKVQNIKAEINKIAEEGMRGYKDVEAYENYARVGDRELYKYKNKKGETSWSLSDSKYADDINTLGLTVKEKNNYYTTKMKMSEVASQFGENDGSKRYRAVIKTISKSKLPSDAKYELFNSWYGKNDNSSKVAQDVGITADDYFKFKTADLSADKNKNGYAIRGSKANKVINFLNKKTDLSVGQKAILYRMSFGYKGNYSSTSYSNKYNTAIVNYINGLNTTYDEDVNIYKTLGFRVDKKGNIWW